MHLRIATDQPWDVAADVLAAPFVGEPTFGGALGEIDRRSGGELKALTAFGEVTGKRYNTTLAAAGDLPAGRLLLVGVGEADKLDRETIHRLGATIERRLGGRKVGRLAVWIGDLAGRIDGGAPTVVELLVRGVVEGHYEPKGIYLDTFETAPPVLDELIVVVPDGDALGLAAAAERGRIIGEGANTARTLANRASNDVSPEVLADEAGAIAERNGLWIDVIEPERARELGMGMFLAVGRGSDNPPRMIVMRSG